MARRGHAIIVCGHAIWQNGQWLGGYAGQEPYYEAHLRTAADLCQLHDDVIVLTGGHTRPELAGRVTNSEAQGMRDWLLQAGSYTLTERILCEDFARDSFENLFFSMLRYYKEFSYWPAKITVVSFPFKRIRFEAMALALQFNNLHFYNYAPGVIPQELHLGGLGGEASILASMFKDGQLVDPFLRSDAFEIKRLSRMPQLESPDFQGIACELLAKVAYDTTYTLSHGKRTGVVTQLLNQVLDTKPGLSWQTMRWPWKE